MNRMKELRDERGISMKDAANALAMPYTTYVNYEKGVREPNSETLIKIADFYNTSIDYLLCKPGAERIDEATLDKVNAIDPDVLSKAGNIYQATAAGINLLDESTGIDSSAIPGLLKEAIVKSGESIEEIAEKTSNDAETLRDILSGRNYALPLWRIAALSYYFQIPLLDMIQVSPNGSPSAIALQKARDRLYELTSAETNLTKEEYLKRREQSYETILQIYTDTVSQLASFEKTIFPNIELSTDLESILMEFTKQIEQLNDPKKEKEIRERIRDIVKILHGNDQKSSSKK